MDSIEKKLAVELERILEMEGSARIKELNEFGYQHGFLDFSMRSRAYMVLLGISDVDMENNQIALAVDDQEETDEVIVNDAKRSFLGYRELSSLPEADLQAQRKDLSHILHYFFKRHKCLSYYQGMNNFGELFLMVFGKSLAYLMLEKLSLKYLRKYMSNQDFDKEVRDHTFITLHILDKELPDFRRFFNIGENGEYAQEKLGFIVSWIVTWFSYKMKDLKMIFRNFDFLMCAPSHTVSIMVALVVRQIISMNKLSLESDDDDVFMAFYSQSLDKVNWEQVYVQAKFLEQAEDYGKLDPNKSSQTLRGILNNLRGKLRRTVGQQEDETILSKNGILNVGKTLKSTGMIVINKGLSFGRSFFKKKEDKPSKGK